METMETASASTSCAHWDGLVKFLETRAAYATARALARDTKRAAVAANKAWATATKEDITTDTLLQTATDLGLHAASATTDAMAASHAFRAARRVMNQLVIKI